MPCKDVTEIIEATVDAEDRLGAYRFVKKTCGQGVGLASLLDEHLCGRPVGEILSIAPEDFLDTYTATEPVEEFLALKHLIAVQSALEVLVGRASGGPDDLCAAAEVRSEADGSIVIEARIKVDLVTERIKACGNCGSCGTERRKKVKPLFALGS